MKKHVRLETIGTVERKREALYSTWENSISTIVIALQISQTTNLIATSKQKFI